jgi:hypothetical protein
MRAMAGFQAVSAVGTSLERLLLRAFTEAPPIPGENARAHLIRTDDLDRTASDVITEPSVSLLLYRVDVDPTTRAAWSGVGASDGRSHLPLDLHYLLTAWASDAEHEHLLLGRALQLLDGTGSLSGPQLDPSGRWEPGETVQVLLEEMSNDDLMRTFDSLQCDYRLSVPLMARVVVVDGLAAVPPPSTLSTITGMAPA